MTRLYTLAYEASSIHERYARLHARVFSLRNQLPIPGLRKRQDHADLARRLSEAHARLAELEVEVDALAPTELGKRAPQETQAALSGYVHALGESVGRLAGICTRLDAERRGVTDCTDDGGTDLRQDTIGYDYAVQEHRRLGERLQRMIDG